MDSSAAEFRDADRHHYWFAKRRSCSKQPVFVYVLLSGTWTDLKPVVLWDGRSSDGEHLFIGENMKFTMAFGYFCISCRARVILACLLADVGAWALDLFKHLSCGLSWWCGGVTGWTLDRGMPDSQAICRTVRWVRGLSSWLNAIFSTTVTLPIARAVRGRPLPDTWSTDPLRSIFANK